MRSLLPPLLVAGLFASCDAFVVAPSLRSVTSARMAALRRPCGLPGLVACAAEGSGGEAAVEDAEYYSVAAIRGKQVVANAVTGMMEVYYLVNWAGFDESENTWELASSLTEGCDEALRATISDFEANERAKKEASGGVFGSLMDSTAKMADAYKKKLNPVIGPEALERNVKATKEYIEKSSAKAQDYLDKTDPILLKKKTDPEQE